MGGIPLFPEQASTFAAEVDALYIFIIAVSAFFTIAVSVAVVFFAVQVPAPARGARSGRTSKGRSRSSWPGRSSRPSSRWSCSSGAPSCSTSCAVRPPRRCRSTPSASSGCGSSSTSADSARSTSCTSRPAGRCDVLVTSEDVLHDLYFPAFRTKIDAIPGRYTPLWFTRHQAWPLPHLLRRVLRHQALRHDRQVVVMEPAQYQSWLSGGGVRRHHGRARRQAVPGSRLHQLPSRQRPGTRAVA